MDTKTKQELELRMLEKAKEYLELVRDYLPEGAHADMEVWTDHISVQIFKGPSGKNDPDPCLIDSWTDPRISA